MMVLLTVQNKEKMYSFDLFYRETLLGQLTVYVKGIRDDFVSRTQQTFSGGKEGGPPKGKNMPEIVNIIVWVRQLESKVWKIVIWAKADLHGIIVAQ